MERYLTCLITLHGSSSIKIYKVGSSTRNLDLIAVKDRFTNLESSRARLQSFLSRTAMQITDSENEGKIVKPKVRLMGNIHGNEDQGIFILLPLIRDIVGLQEYEPLRKSLEMHFLISANPGFYRQLFGHKVNGGLNSFLYEGFCGLGESTKAFEGRCRIIRTYKTSFDASEIDFFNSF